ncbi:MAG: hypothetical protein AAGC53_11905 [Actinomycetota bacterium]
MNLWNILEALIRRWRVTIPMTILAVVVVFRVYTAIAPVYVASGEALLTIPARDDATNPILEGGGSLITLAEAGVAVLRSADENDALLEDGFSEYELEVADRDPIVRFSATDTSPLRAEQTVSRIITRFDEILEELQLQSGAGEEFVVSTVVLQPPSSLVEASSRIRTTLVAAVASVLAVLVVTLSWDELRRSRSAAAGGATPRPMSDAAVAPEPDLEESAAPPPRPVKAAKKARKAAKKPAKKRSKASAPASAVDESDSGGSSRWSRRGDDDLESGVG